MVRCSIWKGRLKGQVTCKPVKLVFCPQCGKRLAETRGGVKNDSLSELRPRLVQPPCVAQQRKALGIPPRPLGGGNSLHLDGEELARLWNDGKSYTEIGKIVGAASQTVKNNLIRNGTIPKPCKKIRFPESQEEIAKLRKMFDGELKTVELAEKLGVGISTVSSWRRRLGIKYTGRGRRRKW